MFKFQYNWTIWDVFLFHSLQHCVLHPYNGTSFRECIGPLTQSTDQSMNKKLPEVGITSMETGNSQLSLISLKSPFPGTEWQSICPHNSLLTPDINLQISRLPQVEKHASMNTHINLYVLSSWGDFQLWWAKHQVYHVSHYQMWRSYTHYCCWASVTGKHLYNPCIFLNPESNSHHPPSFPSSYNSPSFPFKLQESDWSSRHILVELFNVYPSRLGVTECHISKHHSYCRI